METQSIKQFTPIPHQVFRKDRPLRKQHTVAFKAKIVLETLRETKTLAQVSFTANKRVAAENQIHPTLLSKWRTEALSAFPYLFERGAKNAEKSDAQ